MPQYPDDVPSLRALLVEREEEIRRLRLSLDVLSPIDPSTGLLNRNGILDAVDEALNWQHRRNEPFALLEVRIDSLQRLATDDSEDHIQLLRHLGAILASALRRVDKVGHLSGWSLTGVLRDFKLEGATGFIQRIDTVLRPEGAQTEPPTAIEPRITIASVKPGPFHQTGRLMDELLRMTEGSKPGQPVVFQV